jgi:ABC-type multidrug transport system fused ATPase/permease subunit
MRVACFCAAGLGLVFPLFTILFGDLLNSLNGTRALSDVASDFALKFLIIALCAGFGGSVSYGLPVYVAERQMKRVRELYLGSILRQEPAWFDVNKPGEVSSRLAEDTLTWQNGIADKFTQVFSNLVGFVASIVIGFNSNWQIALSVLAIFPAIMVIMIFLKVAISTGEKRASDAYAAAGDCSTEIFNSIRTVAAFCSEAAEAKKYVACLVKARDASKTKGWSMGIAVGSLFFCIYAAYAGGMCAILPTALFYQPISQSVSLIQVPRRLLDPPGPSRPRAVRPLRPRQRRSRRGLRPSIFLRHRRQHHPDIHGTSPPRSAPTMLPTTLRPIQIVFRLFSPARFSSVALPLTSAPSPAPRRQPSK